jgi:hypothetical protein
MKVFVVYYKSMDNKEEFGISGIFSSRNFAEYYIEKIRNDELENSLIEEFDLDKMNY